jgi:hypothetical protein
MTNLRASALLPIAVCMHSGAGLGLKRLVADPPPMLVRRHAAKAEARHVISRPHSGDGTSVYAAIF